jgi:hypothetical protein
MGMEKKVIKRLFSSAVAPSAEVQLSTNQAAPSATIVDLQSAGKINHKY